MFLIQAAKLAWANTSSNWARLAVRCAGVMFAVVLMFMQTGFRNALFDSNVRLAERIDCDFVIRTRARFMLSSGQQMSDYYIVKARGIHDVAQVQPLYIETVTSYLRKPGSPARKVRVIGLEPACQMFRRFDISKFAERLTPPKTAIADRNSKAMFGISETSVSASRPFGELAGQQVHFVGLFELGIDFSNDGNLMMSPENFANYFPHRGNGNPLNQVDYGIVQCGPDADKAQVLRDLRKQLGPHVIVDTRHGFLESERNFWGQNTPVGLIFLVGTIIGFVVGSIICYQVLATDIGDHLGEFATLKAMGYPNLFFAAVVIIQALLLALVSFLPGMVVSLLGFSFVNHFTRMGMSLTADRVLLVLGLTICMCVISAICALRKLITADPANLF